MENGKYGKKESEILLTMDEQDENPILSAARGGEADRIRELLQEKIVVRDDANYEYPTDWKYTFAQLVATTDSEGRTALHLAANIGDPEMSLDCVRALLESLQLLRDIPGGANFIERYQEFVNVEDSYMETALHVAIENKAPDVVAYLLRAEAYIDVKNRKGVEALRLIYEKVPEALAQFYDRAIRFPPHGKTGKPNFKEVSIKWGSIFGYDQLCESDKEDPYDNLVSESTNLRHSLRSEKWGAEVLRHPLVQLYLERKWKKIQWFFWIMFFMEMFWLLLYPLAFLMLSIETVAVNGTGNSTAMMNDNDSESNADVHFNLCILMAVLSLLWGLREAHMLSLLRGAYFGFESILRLAFIVLLWIQCVLMWTAATEVLFALSVIGFIVCTMLMILLLGKTPCWGNQVAAWKKVLYSFFPHLPVFLLWFISFGLIFYALLYQADGGSVLGMIAIMAAMGNGELNAHDHFSYEQDKETPTALRELIRAFAMLFFAILIVTLYFNLLIGHAVTDIQLLKQKAQALELSNKLSTIYSLESLLTSTVIGKAILRIKCHFAKLICPAKATHRNPIDSIYLIPPSEYDARGGKEVMQLTDISPKLRNHVSKIAYENKSRSEKWLKEIKQKRDELLGRRPMLVGPPHQLHYVSAAFTSEGKMIRVLFDPMQWKLDQDHATSEK